MHHLDKDFAVISLDDTAQLTVIQTRNHLNQVLVLESEKLKLGMSLSAEVIEASCQEALGLPLVSWERSAPKRQRTTTDVATGRRGFCFGEIVQGKVRTVKPSFIVVALEDGITGSVHVSEVMELSQVRRGSFPTSSVKVGSVVTARIIGGREASGRRCLSLWHTKKCLTAAEFFHVQSYHLLNVLQLNVNCFVSDFCPSPTRD